MSVYDLARQLGNELLETPEIKRVLEAKKVYEADTKAVKLIEDFNEFQKSYQQKMQNPELTKEEYEALTKQVMEKSDAVKANAACSELINAEQAFNELLNQVFTIVTATISGEDPSGECGGDCSSGCCSSCGGGCH